MNRVPTIGCVLGIRSLQMLIVTDMRKLFPPGFAFVTPGCLEARLASKYHRLRLKTDISLRILVEKPVLYGNTLSWLSEKIEAFKEAGWLMYHQPGNECERFRLENSSRIW